MSAGAAPPPVRGVYEVQLVTRGHEAMVAFYADVLELPVSVRDDQRGRVHFRLGTGQLILARAGGEQVLEHWPGVPPQLYEADDDPVAGPAGHGPVHYAFEVTTAQWDELLGRLAERAPRKVRGPHRWGGGWASVYFLDPDGNCVELIGRRD